MTENKGGDMSEPGRYTRAERPAGPPPSISVVVPTRDRPQRLARCLAALSVQRPVVEFEVVVVDDGSETDLRPVVDGFADRLDVRLLVQPHRGPAAARNLGARRADGDLLAFTDDDCAPDPGWLAALARSASENPGAGLGGHTLNDLVDDPYASAGQILVDHLYGWFNGGRSPTPLYTSNNIAFPTHGFRSIGGFDEGFRLAAGEDRDLCFRWARDGLPLVEVPDAVVRHAHALDLPGYWRQQFRYGRGAYRFHELREDENGSRVRVEPIEFYVRLVSRPFAEGRSSPWRLAALLALSQIANACGYFTERLIRQKEPQRRATKL